MFKILLFVECFYTTLPQTNQILVKRIWWYIGIFNNNSLITD